MTYFHNFPKVYRKKYGFYTNLYRSFGTLPTSTVFDPLTHWYTARCRCVGNFLPTLCRLPSKVPLEAIVKIQDYHKIVIFICCFYSFLGYFWCFLACFLAQMGEMDYLCVTKSLHKWAILGIHQPPRKGRRQTISSSASVAWTPTWHIVPSMSARLYGG